MHSNTGAELPIPAKGAQAAAPSRAERLFIDLLRQHLRDASLLIIDGGRRHAVGQSGAAELVLRVHRPDFYARVLLQGNLGMGESFMEGGFDVDDGRLADVLAVLLKARMDRKTGRHWRYALRYGALLAGNLLAGKTRNVRRHYDVGEDLFDSFLHDRYQVYSCGYARNADADIDTLQHDKLDRICQKLELAPRQTLLDVGCGKGGLLIHAARHYGVKGTGVTNSLAHWERANALINHHGVGDRVKVLLQDYASVAGVFDRVVSVGMLEHLPRREYPRYFQTLAKALRQNGRGLVHAIGCNTRVNRHDPFIQRYIFPGSDTPKLSAITRQLENNHLAILDAENLVRHYAVTAQRWLEAFRAHGPSLDAKRYDAAFKRMWEYYLCCGIAAARAGEAALYQVLFTNDYHAPYRYQRV